MPKGKKSKANKKAKLKTLESNAIPDESHASTKSPLSHGESATVRNVDNNQASIKNVVLTTSTDSGPNTKTVDATCTLSPNTNIANESSENLPPSEEKNLHDLHSNNEPEEVKVTAPESSSQLKDSPPVDVNRVQPPTKSDVEAKNSKEFVSHNKVEDQGLGKFNNYHYSEKNYGGYEKSEKDLFYLSKALVTLLRHGHPKDIKLDEYGYAKVDDILRHYNFRKFHTSPEEIEDVVKNNDKKRFEMSEDLKKIRAVQGHSRTFKETNIGMKQIFDASLFPNVFHGTYEQYWRRIEKEGLKRMSRTHIHFAIGEINESHVTSGMKRDSEIILKLDLAGAIQDGLKFFLSSNNVILAPGDEHGTVPPKYIKLYKIWDNKLGVYKPHDYRQLK